MSFDTKEGWHFCAKCGKKMIKRLPNGLWHFAFGRRKWMTGSTGNKCPVNLFIHGSVRIQCLSESCRYMNTFTYFPNNPVKSESNESEEEIVQEES